MTGPSDTEAVILTDEERSLMNCDCHPRLTRGHADICFVPAVESILAARLAGAGAQVTEAADPGCVQWQYGACTCEHECPDDRPHMGTGQSEDDLRARISALADKWENDHDDADDCETCWLIQEVRALLDRPAAEGDAL